MYDSTSAADIPAGAQMVAGYVDGAYAWSPADWDRFPAATLVRIATQPATDDGDVLDVELGDATPAQAPAWVRMRQAAGLAQPALYCGLSTVSTLRHLCQGLLYSLWVADWTGVAHPLSYASAVQYADSRQSGGHYDLSIVYDAWWPGPHQPPATGGDDMTLDLARILVYDWYAGILHRIPTQAEIDGWAAQLATPGVNSESVYGAFLATPEASAAMAKERGE